MITFILCHISYPVVKLSLSIRCPYIIPFMGHTSIIVSPQGFQYITKIPLLSISPPLSIAQWHPTQRPFVKLFRDQAVLCQLKTRRPNEKEGKSEMGEKYKGVKWFFLRNARAISNCGTVDVKVPFNESYPESALSSKPDFCFRSAMAALRLQRGSGGHFSVVF